MQEINDELMMPCAQCCRKHLSAAIAYFSTMSLSEWGPAYIEYMAKRDIFRETRELVARALINLNEADEGYESHRLFAIGLLVMAEERSPSVVLKKKIRDIRLTSVQPGTCVKSLYVASEDECIVNRIELYGFHELDNRDWFFAHIAEAIREYPDIESAIDKDQFLEKANITGVESMRQAEVNYRLAQLRWLDENVFGYKPKEKGEEKMACGKKPAKAPVKAAAKKAACKGGKCKK